MRQQHAVAIYSVDAAGSFLAHAGDAEVARSLPIRVAPDSDGSCRAGLAAVPGGGDGEATDEGGSCATTEPRALLFAHAAQPYAASVVPLTTGRRLVGRLVAVERLEAARLVEWSRLCGAGVAFRERNEAVASLDRVVIRLGSLDLRVEGSLTAERAALRNSRRHLLQAGAVALALAFTASFLLARGLVRPLVAMRRAAERIGRGTWACASGADAATRSETWRAHSTGCSTLWVGTSRP